MAGDPLATPMKWGVTFRKPFALKDGRTIDTLSSARDFILRLPEVDQRSAKWKYASELVFTAADRGERYAVMDARNQLERALKAQGLA
jgi:hypothetical protein